MAKYLKFISLILVVLLSTLLYGCGKDNDEENIHVCSENLTEWEFDQEYPCEALGKQIRKCRNYIKICSN